MFQFLKQNPPSEQNHNGFLLDADFGSIQGVILTWKLNTSYLGRTPWLYPLLCLDASGNVLHPSIWERENAVGMNDDSIPWYGHTETLVVVLTYIIYLKYYLILLKRHLIYGN